MKLSLTDIEYLDMGIMITIPTTKNNTIRQFVIGEGDDSEVNLIDIFKKYAYLRPNDSPTTRFFVGYRHGKCIKQPIGINTFGSYPQRIATFLQLPSSSEYTGHSFRRSSAAFLADSHVNWSIVKRQDVSSKRQIESQILSDKILKTEHGSSSNIIKIEQSSDTLSDSFDSVDCSDSIDPFDSIENVHCN